MAEVGALLRGKNLPKLPLRLLRVLGSVGQPQPAADADTVGVADHAAGHAVQVPQQKICGLSANAGNFQKLLHGAGDFSAIVPDQRLAAQNDVPGLVLIESAGPDQFFHTRDIRPGHGLQGGKFGEEGRGDLIHTGVGALGREPDSKQQLVVLFVYKRADGVGVEAFQRLDDAFYSGFGFHGSSPR